MDNQLNFNHVSVLLEECIELLCIKEDGIYVDGTAGGGGHSFEIAKRLKNGKLYAFDQDPSAIKAAGKKLSNLPAVLVHSNFSFIKRELNLLGIDKIDGALLDLGVSSHQLDERERGFSYHGKAPLDMRMSQSGRSAADIVNNASRQELANMLRDYAQESNAWNIAGKIVAAREISPILTTAELVSCVISATPAAVRRKDKNPARKTFQAIRIAVNNEFDALEKGLNDIFDVLKPGGRICVITFHSLEDRIVKKQFKEWATGCICPPEFPVVYAITNQKLN